MQHSRLPEPQAVRLHLDAGVHHKCPLLPEEVVRIVAAMLDETGVPGATLELTLVTDSAMEQINSTAMLCRGPTNILSFPQPGPEFHFFSEQPEGAGAFLGSLVLSVDTLARECALYGQPPVEHAIRLLAHGCAHLQGHDHGPAMESVCLRLEKAAAAAYTGNKFL